MGRRIGLAALALLLRALPAGGEPPLPIELAVPMRDGQSLAADLYLPAGGPWPTILVQTPYDRTRYRTEGLPLATEQYAFLIVDWRGYFGSAGAASPTADRGEDGYDCVEWIAAQPWSSGAVGTWGSSALAYAQFVTARERPPHLLAAVPQFGEPVRDYQQFFLGGAQKLEYMVQQALLGYIDYQAVLEHPRHDLYWTVAESLGTAVFPQVDVPMLVVAGWYDLDPRDVLEAYQALVSMSEPSVRGLHRLLVGPWTHAAESRLAQGELSYPAAVGVAASHSLAFFDQLLLGVGSGPPGPRVQWFEMGRDRWRGGPIWPPPGVVATPWHLLPGGRISPEDPPADDPTFALEADPDDPSPTWGGPRSGPNLLDGPVDLRSEVESRSDVAVFTSEPLEQPLALLGTVRLEAAFESDRLDADLVVRLTDVYPDGRSMLVADGARRGRFRNGYESEELLVPGAVTTLEVALSPTGLTLLPGHRLRLDLTGSSFPRLHVNPNDGAALYQPGATPLLAHNHLHLGVAAPTRLWLPIVSALPFDDDFESGDTRAWRLPGAPQADAPSIH